jgi:cobalt/nickel transport system permease protein
VFSDAFLHLESPIHRLDTRVRVLVAVAWSVAIAAVSAPAAVVVGLVAAVALAATARLPLRATLRRLIPLNLFLAVLCMLIPLTTPGPALFYVHTLAVTWPGLLAGIIVAARANAIVLILTALLTTMEVADLGRSLCALRVPPKLVTLLLLTGRYVFVLQTEYQRLRRAMRVRSFTPGTNWHTLRTLGYLVGMLAVNGFDRSERILQAMKCRGYTGEFPLRETSSLQRRDLGFSAVAVTLLVALFWTNAQ